jgi:hypothetical protein
MSALGLALGQAGRAFRTNLPAMAAVLVLGTLVLTSYALVPAVHQALDAWAAWTGSLGLWYPILAFPLVGGLIPVLVTGRWPRGRAWAVILGFWPERGLEIHALYAGMGAVIGTGRDAGTILTKTALDMFVYSAFWALPVYLLVLAWAGGERPLALVRTAAFWRDRYLPGLLANWMLWIPAVLMIYSLPPGLQLPVQNLFLVIWVLVAAVINRRTS